MRGSGATSSVGEGCITQTELVQEKSWQESSKDTNCTSSQITQNAYNNKWPTDSKSDQEQSGLG